MIGLVIYNNVREISIYDIAGKLVYTSTSEQDQITINATQFGNGVYLVKVFDGKNEFVRRIIK